ncbi:MAG: Glu/Leu/Phe/Val dehydrogenase [Planctomycetes bacterium]|nr:Glu/Leu/Phe/Val dehydrogenase [Planctomycetota bacterium]
MDIIDLEVDGYERVVRTHDGESGLHALIAVHDTTMGPALGGMRMWPYASEDEALTDVLRLSKGMTYKSAVAHTGLGGGKAVVIGDPNEIKSEALFLAMGRFVDSLGGKYITAEDVNIAVPDLEIVRRTTKYVTGLSREDGGSGNPSPYTAYGVFLGLCAACEVKFGSEDLSSRSVAVQGVGAVGSALVRRLRERGAKVWVCDVRNDRAREVGDQYGAEVVSMDAIFDVDADVFAPCALGAVVNDATIDRLNVEIVAGGANNVLHEARHGAELFRRGVLYAPDYVINAGGIINVSVEFAPGGYDQETSLKKIERIPAALKEVWEISASQGIPASDAADHLAESILAEARRG